MALAIALGAGLSIIESDEKMWIGTWERLYYPGETVTFTGRKLGWKWDGSLLERQSDGAVFWRKCGVCVEPSAPVMNRSGL